jgi:hypothetical protein
MVSLKTLKVGFYLMNFLKNLATTTVAGVLLAGGLSLAQVDRAAAAGLTFEDAGTSLDGPAQLKSIETSVGSPISFKLFLDTNGIASDDLVSKLLYSFKWDTTELKIVSFTPLDQMIFGTGTSGPAGFYNIEQILDPARMASRTSVQIATVTFQVLAGLNNNNAADFTLNSLGAFNASGAAFTNIFATNTQLVEVQGKPVPTPALIPGIAAMGMGLLRRKKAQAVAA